MYGMPSPTTYAGYNQYYPGFAAATTGAAAGAPATAAAPSPATDPNAASNWGASYSYWGGKWFDFNVESILMVHSQVTTINLVKLAKVKAPPNEGIKAI
jgi:hypothetical protein